jgi:hypothetical protein
VTVWKRCGTRASLWLKKIYNSDSIILPGKIEKVIKNKDNTWEINRRLEESAKRELKKDNWIYNVEKPYWDQTDEVQLYNWPHKFLYQKLA